MGICFRCAAALLVPVLLYAHPHIFVDLSVNYDAPQKRLHVDWLIDDITSGLILLDHDTNRNGHLEPEEAKMLLSPEGYAMLFYRGGFFLHPGRPVEHLKADLQNGRVNVSFDTAVPSGAIGIWDHEYLFSFHLKHASGIVKSETADPYFGYRLELP
ncbi:MAG: DUF1007 family protein [Campylobacterales bacterium]